MPHTDYYHLVLLQDLANSLDTIAWPLATLCIEPGKDAGTAVILKHPLSPRTTRPGFRCPHELPIVQLIHQLGNLVSHTNPPPPPQAP